MNSPRESTVAIGLALLAGAVMLLGAYLRASSADAVASIIDASAVTQHATESTAAEAEIPRGSSFSVEIMADVRPSAEMAFSESRRTGRPILALVTRASCAACRAVERDVLPNLRQSRAVKRVAFCVVDVDREPAIAEKLLGNGERALPQFVLFHPQAGAQSARLVGYHPLKSVEELIDGNATALRPIHADATSDAVFSRRRRR